MASEETVAEIVKEMRSANVIYGANDSYRPMTRFEKALLELYADRIEAAYEREGENARIAACSEQARWDEEIEDKLRVIRELNEVRELNRKCCDENERLNSEVAELRECLKEAVEWACGNPDEACEDCVAHGGDTPCKCEKWRKALEGAKDETK